MALIRLKEAVLIGLLISGISIAGCGGGGNIDEGVETTNTTSIKVPYIDGVPYATQSQVDSSALCNKFCSPSFLKFMPAACATYCPSHNNSAGLSYLTQYFKNSSDRLSTHPQSNTIGLGSGATFTACTLGGCQPGWYCEWVDDEGEEKAMCVRE